MIELVSKLFPVPSNCEKYFNYIQSVFLKNEDYIGTLPRKFNTGILGDSVKNESQPILEILADDVKASHGATTGRIPEENIYYLESRGLDKEEAKVLIVEGFFEELLSKIHDQQIAQEVRDKLFNA